MISEDYGDRLGHRHFHLYWRLFPQVAPIVIGASNIVTIEGPGPGRKHLHESQSEAEEKTIIPSLKISPSWNQNCLHESQIEHKVIISKLA